MAKQLVNFKMDRGEYADVREKAERDGVNLSALLRAYLRKWMSGSNSALGAFIRWLHGQLPQDYWFRLVLRARQGAVDSCYDGQTKVALNFLIGIAEELYQSGEEPPVPSDYNDQTHYRGRTRLFKGDPPEQESK